jgi:hypothetical protein
MRDQADMIGDLRADNVSSCWDFNIILTFLWPYIIDELSIKLQIMSESIPEIEETRMSSETWSELSVCADTLAADTRMKAIPFYM